VTAAAPRHDPYAALRTPNFRWFIVSLFAMTIAEQMQVLVVSWQIYRITHDPLSLGLIGLAEAVPFIGCSLWGGHLADRVNRRVVALLGLSTLVLSAAALFVINLTPIATGAHGVWPFYLVIMVSGVARSFLGPSRQALGAELIPRALYPNAIAWRSSTWQSAAVLGPAAGGLLYGFTSATVAYAVQVVLLLFALLAFAAISYASPTSRHAPGSDGGGLLSGVRFVLRERVLLGAQALDLFSVLLAGAEALLPVFADQVLHVGPKELGLLRGAPALGAVLMSLFLAHRPPFRRAGRALLLAVATFALTIIAFGLSRNLYLSAGVLVVSGMADNVSVLVRSTLIQVLTPPHLLGRVMAVNAIFVGSSNEIGAFESGVAARLMGAVPAVLFGGFAALGVVGVVARKIPELRTLGVIQDRTPMTPAPVAG
jgi:MFS family permease